MVVMQNGTQPAIVHASEARHVNHRTSPDPMGSPRGFVVVASLAK